MTNECPKCGYKYVHNVGIKERYLEETDDGKFKTRVNNEKKYECRKCGWHNK